MAWAVNRPAAGTAYSLPTRLFPADNWWNLDISAAPLDPLSDHYIMGTPALYDFNSYDYVGFAVGGLSTMKTDFGDSYGFPFCTVSGDHPTITFSQINYSGGASGDDTRGYPIPVAALTEAGWTEDLAGTIDSPVWLNSSNSFKDRHLLIWDVDNQYLYEIYQPYHNATASPVNVVVDPGGGNPLLYPYGAAVIPAGGYACASCSFWDAKTNNVRPDGVTSSDAAGLQVLPGLLQYDEAMGTVPLTHAFRTYCSYASYEQPHYVFPATHEAGNYTRGMLPFGARVRLKASFDLDVFPFTAYPNATRILRACKTYGMIMTDNSGGGATHGALSGTNDARWGNYESPIRAELVTAFSLVPLSAYELVELGYNPPTSSRIRITDLSFEAPSSSTGQHARPTADLAAGSWTPSTPGSLYPMVDETTASDTDYIYSSTTPSDTAQLRLRGANKPIAGSSFLRVRAKRG